MGITVVGLLDSQRAAESAVRELTSVCRCDRADINLIAREAEDDTRMHGSRAGRIAAGALKGALLGAALGGAAGFIASSTSLALPGFEAIIAIGPMASGIAGAVIGLVAGAVLGALFNTGNRDEDTNYFAPVRRAGTLITVHTRDDMEADCAVNVLRRHGAMEIDRRSSDWKKQGWGGGLTPEEPVLQPEPEHAVGSTPPLDATGANSRSYSRSMEETAPPRAQEQPAAADTPREEWIMRKYIAIYFGPERRKSANQPYSGAERRQAA
jgi:uncharacterized protein YcfJ